MKLIAVTDGKKEEDKLVPKILLISPYVDGVILREKQKALPDYLSLVNRLIECGLPKEKLYVHRHYSLVKDTGIRNLHLPEKGYSLREVRRTFPHITLGVSVHSLESAHQVEKDGADYVIFGHIYSTNSKKGVAPRGLELLQKMTSSLSIPVLAIGGIHSHHMKEVAKAGATGVAVMSGVFGEKNPLQAVKKYKKEALVYDRSR
ncbi:thiamine phosphate synthase [Halobacillus mangrovi]|uniref:thiamine phosphate synthase n=1 Tax=Halobacillus mangrovi TaxID=402384 RepID=UPI0018DB205D|nr:thiamine phosphate synthase [Halobacillus mangrovi]